MSSPIDSTPGGTVPQITTSDSWKGTKTPTVVIGAYRVATAPEIGGHFWVYLQYALGLRQLGCDVYWLEALRARGRPDEEEAAALATFRERMHRYGFGGKCILYTTHKRTEAPTDYV